MGPLKDKNETNKNHKKRKNSDLSRVRNTTPTTGSSGKDELLTARPMPSSLLFGYLDLIDEKTIYFSPTIKFMSHQLSENMKEKRPSLQPNHFFKTLFITDSKIERFNRPTEPTDPHIITPKILIKRFQI